jgi:hypothetical protein
VPHALFMETASGPHEHEKDCVHISRPRRTGRHNVNRMSHLKEKHKFDVTCPGGLFMETTLGPLELEKMCIDDSRPGHTGMHYVNCRSDRMQTIISA